jgi:hypothetical protein
LPDPKLLVLLDELSVYLMDFLCQPI